MRPFWWIIVGGACVGWACSLNPQPLPPDSPTDVDGPRTGDAGPTQGISAGADAATSADGGTYGGGGLTNTADSGSSSQSPSKGDGGSTDGQSTESPPYEGGADGAATDADRDARGVEAGSDTDASGDAAPSLAED